MSKHFNQTEETIYRAVFHPENAHKDTEFDYFENLDKARERIADHNLGECPDNCDVWIETYNRHTKEWDEVDG